MPDDALYPLSEAEALIAGFTNCTLTKEDWTHEAHLVAGLYLVAKYGGDALPEMRARLLRFNESVGGVNDDYNGYHETMSVFWLWVIQKHCAGTDGIIRWDQNTLDDLILSEYLTDRNIWKEYYSEELMKSVEARRGLVGADKKALD